MNEMGKRKNHNVTAFIIYGVFVLLYVFITQYFFLIPINIHCGDFWWTSIVFCLLSIMILLLFSNDSLKSSKTKSTPVTIFIQLFTFLATALIVVGTLFWIIGLPMFNAKKYANLITIEEGENTDIPEIETDPVVVVDQKSAQKIGDRQIANVDNSSFYEVNDEYNLININGKFVRVSPLEYGSRKKENKAKNIPAYIEVEATNSEEAQNSRAVVMTKPMLYSPKAHFDKNLERAIHFKYPTAIIDYSLFEIDDNENSYWITPIKTPTIGWFGGCLEKEVIIFNASTGDSQKYKTDELPSWVDHAHSVEYLFELVGYHYLYINGYLNVSPIPFFGSYDGVSYTSYSYRETYTIDEENEYTPFEGYNFVIGTDGKIWAYTGITPANNSESNQGFVLVNTTNPVAKFYTCKGAEESTVQNAAENGKIADLHYSATFPTIGRIGNEMVYIMILKDSAGLVQYYTISNVENFYKLSQERTLEEAIDVYLGNFEGRTKIELAESEAKITNISGKVATVKQATKEGNTYFFIVLEGDENIYVSPITISNKQPILLKDGAEVTIKYHESNEDGVEIVTGIEIK